MSYDSGTDAVVGQTNDLLTAVNNLIAEAQGVSIAAAAIGMTDLPSKLDAMVVVFQAQAAILSAELAVCSDIKKST